jgi:peroxiredoxin
MRTLTKAAEFGITRVLFQKEREVSDVYQCHGVPGAVLLSSEGKIGSPLAMGPHAIRSLVSNATLPPPAQVGDLAPTVKLPDVDGHTADLSEFAGRKTLLLFWNPQCGACRAMLDEFKSWERKLNRATLGVLLVSTGTAEENRQQGIQSRIAQDDNFATARAFGVHGTPSAVLVDEEGRIASEVAVGTHAVMALAREPVPVREGESAAAEGSRGR